MAGTNGACEANAATLVRERGRFEQARSGYRSVLERLRELVGDDHHAVARAQSLLADTERLAGRPEAAFELFDQSLRRQRAPDVNDLDRAETTA